MLIPSPELARSDISTYFARSSPSHCRLIVVSLKACNPWLKYSEMAEQVEHMEDTVLAKLDAANLEALGSASPAYHGKRKVSSSAWSLTSSLTSPATSSSLDETSKEIPEVMRSKQTYLYLGLSEQLANELWILWTKIDEDDRGPDGPISFLSLAESVVHFHDGDVWCEYEDWPRYIVSLGFVQEVADAICDPAFNTIRFTASAKYWLLDTMQLRWRSLEELQEISRSRLRRAQNKGSPSLAIRGGEGKSEKNPEYVPGSTVLWRGSDNRYLRGLVHPITGAIDLDRMQATWPSDYRGLQTTGAVYYLSPQKDVALKYAGFVRRRSDSSTTSLVRMEVPNSLLEKHNPHILQHDDSNMWRIVIWHCRTRRRIPDPYSHLNNATILIGPICTSSSSIIEKLASWQDVTDRHILMVNEQVWDEKEMKYQIRERRGIQYAFTGYDIQLDLEKEAKIDLHPCS